MQLSYIKIFLDCLECIEPLDDAERGRLFTALLEYARTGEIPVLQGNERFLFPTLRLQLDRDSMAYENKCETNRHNGATGGRPPKKPDGFSETQDKEKEEEKDKDSSSRGASRPARTREKQKNFFQKKRETPEENQRYIEQMNRYLAQLHQEAREQAIGKT